MTHILDPRQDTPREIAARHVTQDGLTVTVLGVPLSYLSEARAMDAAKAGATQL